MAIKKRSPTTKSVEALANELADKPYGDSSSPLKEDELTRVSISISVGMQQRLEDFALKNKRSGGDLKSTSAIIRAAVEEFLDKN